MTWAGGALWLVDRKGQKILKISPEDGTTIREIPAPTRYTGGLAFDGTYLWAADRAADKIYMLTPDRGQVVLMLDAPGPYPRGLCWDGEALRCVDYQDNAVYRLKIDDPRPYKKSDEKIEYVEYTHEVRNYGPDPVKTLDVYLAIPGARENQDILEGPVFSPEPLDYLQDQWGQKLAHFRFEDLEAPGTATVSFTAKVRLSTIRYYVFPDRVKTLSDIPEEIVSLYCGDMIKYMLNDDFIVIKAKELAGDETNPYWIARRMYDYVISSVSYEMVGGWNVAPMVLERGTGSCSEYSFALIALCRAAGVPARYVGSIVIRGEDASLDEAFHRWVEIYLPDYGWVPFDANAGDRTLPADQAAGIGEVENRFLITTEGGGGSTYLAWGYNSNHVYTCGGRCKVELENIGEWRPGEAPGESEK
jgi:transglutaminase-like putative cysteine protease